MRVDLLQMGLQYLGEAGFGRGGDEKFDQGLNSGAGQLP